MAVSQEQEAQASLLLAKEAIERANAADADAARLRLRFLRDARRAGWSWRRVGDSLGLTDVAVRRYWDRNRHGADRTGRSSDEVVSESAGALAA